MSSPFEIEDAEAPVDPLDEEPQPETTEINRKKAWKAWRARLRRREKIQRVADAAVELWLRFQGFTSMPQPMAPGALLLRPLPRPRGLGLPKNAEPSALPPPLRAVTFNAGVMQSIARLVFWIYGASLFTMSVLWDRMQGHRSQECQAQRLREAFEEMGTTFIKIGQQLSMRRDLLADAYTSELEKMLDKVPPFPTDEAIRIIERTTEQPLKQIFSAFDPDPIGSASVACVYQAVLQSGERVAVKVRRPGIGPRLAADMRALGWLLMVIEQILFTPGFFDNFMFELKNMLMEELDFNREARFADLYRHRMRKIRQFRFVSVPKVFFDYSNDEVMVTEFVSGVWLKDIFPALETENAQALAKLEEMHFDRVILARRIQLIARFNNFENIFFHADLHPANILIQPGNKIVLIDFGSCGSFNTRELNSWRRWFDAQSVDDVAGMVQAALAIIEPLPPIDRDTFGQRLELKFWNELYAVKSKHSNWQERISSRLWYGFLELSREFQIPMRLNTLRMIRASLLTDTIAARLDNDQDAYREFRYYEKGAGKRAKWRVKKRLHRLLSPRKFIGLEHEIESALKLVYQIQRTVDSLASIRIADIITKASYFVMLIFKHIVWVLVTFALFFGYQLYADEFFKDRSFDVVIFQKAFLKTLLNWVWIVIAVAPDVLVLWRMNFRLKERRPWNS